MTQKWCTISITLSFFLLTIFLSYFARISTYNMVASSVLGFPRIGMSISAVDYHQVAYISFIGGNREVKKAVEAYWAGKIPADELTKVAADVKKTSWNSVKAHGVDYIPR